MEKLIAAHRSAAREQTKPHNKNQNFRRPPVPQIRQREQRNPGDQAVRPPFQANFVTDEYEDPNENQIHQVDQNEPNVYLTKEEHDRWYNE